MLQAGVSFSKQQNRNDDGWSYGATAGWRQY
jgi:hypothetical protein